jgi:hypothetical protein
MMDAWEDFILDITKVEVIRQVKDEALDEWGGDIPRSLIFSKFGKGISDNFDNLSPSDRDHIFSIIERGMQFKQNDLKALVATGLLESLYMRASRDVMLWERVYEKLGEKSRQYLLE